jgi:hypothetical protein
MHYMIFVSGNGLLEDVPLELVSIADTLQAYTTAHRTVSSLTGYVLVSDMAPFGHLNVIYFEQASGFHHLIPFKTGEALKGDTP